MTTGMNHDDLSSAIPLEWFTCSTNVDGKDMLELGLGGRHNAFRDRSDSTIGPVKHAGVHDDFEDYLGLDAMPPTREPSPEPLWRSNNCYALDQEHRSLYEQIQARSNLFRKSSGEPPLQHFVASMPTQLNQTVLINSQLVLVPHQNMNSMFHGGVTPSVGESMPTPSVDHVPFGMPASNEPWLPQPDRRPSISSSELKPAPAPEQESQRGSPQANQTAEAKACAQVKGESVFDNLSEDQKEALCKYIYDFMIEKKLTNPEGYLVIDIFCDIWKDMGASPRSWRVAQGRFGDLLSFAPHYFRVFRKSIRVANPSGWSTRKGQKMVKIVVEK